MEPKGRGIDESVSQDAEGRKAWRSTAFSNPVIQTGIECLPKGSLPRLTGTTTPQ